MNNKEHILYLDLLRLISIFAVVLLHTSCIFINYDNITLSDIAVWYDALVRWCVPILIMISGAIFCNPYYKNITIEKIWTKYIPHLICVLIFWHCLYVFCFNPLQLLFTKSYYEIGDIKTLKYHLWFLPMIIGLYSIAPFLRSIVKDGHTKYFLLFWFAYLSFYFFSQRTPIIKYYIDLFHIKMIVGYSGLYLLGYYLSVIKTNKSMCIIRCGGGLAL